MFRYFLFFFFMSMRCTRSGKERSRIDVCNLIIVKMNVEDMLELFPSSWHDFLSQEQSDFNECSIDGVERSLLNEMGGSYLKMIHTLFPSSVGWVKGHPDWQGLLSALVMVDDTADQERICRFYKLPIHLQRTVLGLISHHALEIPLPLLQKLTRCIQDGRLTDHWALFHLHELQNHIATYFPKPNDQRSKVTPMTARFLSEPSKELFREICQSISAGENSPEESAAGSCRSEKLADTHSASSGFQCFFNHFKEIDKADIDGSKVKRDIMLKRNLLNSSSMIRNEQTQAIHPLDNPVGSIPSNLVQHRPKRLKQDTDVDEALVQPPPVLDDKALASIVEESELPEGGESISGSDHVADAVKMKAQATGAEVVRMENEEVSFIHKLSPDIKMMLDVLKSEWHKEGSSGHTEQCSEALKFMATCTSDQLLELCDYLEIGDIDASDLPVVCQSITPLADQFSFTATRILAKKFFLDKVTSLTERASRALNSALVTFAQAFPKPTVEGALTPSVVHSKASFVQYDLVSKVAKDALTNELRAYLLQSMLACSNLVWSEQVSGFVQTLIDVKLEIDSSLLTLLAASLGKNGTSQSKCKKFAKLLLAVINKYNKQMTPDHVTNLQMSVEVNQTFLKKACQAALKKIKL